MAASTDPDISDLPVSAIYSIILHQIPLGSGAIGPVLNQDIPLEVFITGHIKLEEKYNEGGENFNQGRTHELCKISGWSLEEESSWTIQADHIPEEMVTLLHTHGAVTLS